MLRFVAKRPLLSFAILTVILCVACGPHAVGAWYHSCVMALVRGVVAFGRGLV